MSAARLDEAQALVRDYRNTLTHLRHGHVFDADIELFDPKDQQRAFLLMEDMLIALQLIEERGPRVSSTEPASKPSA